MVMLRQRSMDEVGIIAAEEAAGPRAAGIAEAVREQILNGAIASGDRINEVHLARALGVSRTPVRAALHSLAAEGLLDYARNRGFSVRVVPREAVVAAYEIRAALEGLACRFAAERGLSDPHRRVLVDVLSRGDALLSEPELTAASLADYRAVNVAFHETILAVADNRMLADAIRLTLNIPDASNRHIVTFHHREVRRRHDDHHRIFDLIAAGDGWRAEMLMREHIASIRASVAPKGAVRHDEAQAVRDQETGGSV